jgi:hypothetical protein
MCLVIIYFRFFHHSLIHCLLILLLLSIPIGIILKQIFIFLNFFFLVFKNLLEILFILVERIIILIKGISHSWLIILRRKTSILILLICLVYSIISPVIFPLILIKIISRIILIFKTRVFTTIIMVSLIK